MRFMVKILGIRNVDCSVHIAEGTREEQSVEGTVEVQPTEGIGKENLRIGTIRYRIVEWCSKIVE